jgi:hypothetical protein
MFELKFSTASAAFDDTPATEIARILRDIAKRVANNGDEQGRIHDVNGNGIGAWQYRHGE